VKKTTFMTRWTLLGISLFMESPTRLLSTHSLAQKPGTKAAIAYGTNRPGPLLVSWRGLTNDVPGREVARECREIRATFTGVRGATR
jgi:hypothetical protein